MGHGIFQEFLLFTERPISQFAIISCQSQIAQSMQIAVPCGLPVIAKHLLPCSREVLILRHDMLDGEIIYHNFFFALILNCSQKIFAQRILAI